MSNKRTSVRFRTKLGTIPYKIAIAPLPGGVGSTHHSPRSPGAGDWETVCSRPVRESDMAPNPKNRLLALLSERDLDAVRPHLEALELPVRFDMEKPSRPIEYVYFPETGM